MSDKVRFSSAKLACLSKDGNWGQSFSLESFYCVLEINGQPNFETPLLGKQMIEEAQKTYLSGGDKNLDLLKKIMAVVQEKKTSDYFLSVAVCFKKDQFLYLGVLGKSRILIKRGEQLALVLSGEKEIGTASGLLKDNDRVVLETESFAKAVLDEKLAVVLDNREAQETADILAPEIQSLADFSGAATIIKVIFENDQDQPENQLAEETDLVKDQPLVKESPPAVEEKENFIIVKVKIMARWLKRILNGFWRRLIRLFNSKPIYLNQTSLEENKHKKTLKTIVLILLVILGVSLVFSFKKKRQSEAEIKFQQTYKIAAGKKDEGQALIDLNPVRARVLLNEGLKAINEAKEIISQDKELAEKINQLAKVMEKSLETTAKIYHLNNLSLFLNLQSDERSIDIKAMVLNKDSLFVSEEKDNTVYQINQDSKSIKVLAKAKELKEIQEMVLLEDYLYLLDQDRILQINLTNQEKKTTLTFNKGEIKSMAGFISNLYLLNQSAKQIKKYVKQETGFAKPIDYLDQESSVSLSEPVSLTIDGAVYVLEKNGQVFKFLQGKKETFKISGLDMEFKEPRKIYTTEDLNNIYLLDSGNNRIVVFDKKGQYQSQYVSDEISQAAAFIVSSDEKTIYLASGSKIFKIEVK